MTGPTPPAAGAAAELEEYYRRRGDAVRRYARAVLGLAAARELDDVVQDAWARALAHWERGDPAHRDAWMFRIVRNCCLDRHRERERSERLAVRLTTPDTADDPVARQVEARRGLDVLYALPQVQREALWLRDALDLTYAEIAELQEVPVGTVMSRLFTARRAALRLLEAGDG